MTCPGLGPAVQVGDVHGGRGALGRTRGRAGRFARSKARIGPFGRGGHVPVLRGRRRLLAGGLDRGLLTVRAFVSGPVLIGVLAADLGRIDPGLPGGGGFGVDPPVPGAGDGDCSERGHRGDGPADEGPTAAAALRFGIGGRAGRCRRCAGGRHRMGARGPVGAGVPDRLRTGQWAPMDPGERGGTAGVGQDPGGEQRRGGRGLVRALREQRPGALAGLGECGRIGPAVRRFLLEGAGDDVGDRARHGGRQRRRVVAQVGREHAQRGVGPERR